MSVTVAELKILTKRRLDESYLSRIGEVSDGQGAALTVDGSWAVPGGTTLNTNAFILECLNRAGVEWAQTALYLRGTATKTWASGVGSYRLNELTPPSGQGNLWALETVTTTSGTETRLSRISHSEMATLYPDYSFASGAPSYWATESGTVELDKKPSSGTAMKFYGLALPATLTADSDTVSYMEDAEVRVILPLMAAIFMVRRRITAPDVYGRLPDLVAEYGDHYNRHRAKISPDVLRAYFREMSPDLAPVKPR